jgi:hypothetical protein
MWCVAVVRAYHTFSCYGTIIRAIKIICTKDILVSAWSLKQNQPASAGDLLASLADIYLDKRGGYGIIGLIERLTGF